MKEILLGILLYIFFCILFYFIIRECLMFIVNKTIYKQPYREFRKKVTLGGKIK